MKNACHATPPGPRPRRRILALMLAGSAACLAVLAVRAEARAGTPAPSALAVAGRSAEAENPLLLAQEAEAPAPEASPVPEEAEATPPPAPAEEPEPEAVPEEAPAEPAPGATPAPAPAAQPPTPPPPLRPRTVRPGGPRPPRPGVPAIPGAPGGPSAPKQSIEIAEEPSPEDKIDPDTPINFNFEDSELIEIIKSVGRYTGKNFDIDASVMGQRATIIMHDPVPAAMAYEVLESVLASRMFSLIPSVDGQLVKVVPAGKLQEKPPLVQGAMPPAEGFDRISTHVVGVENASAEAIRDLIQTLGSESAAVDVYAPTNTLILTDNADGIRRMLEFLKIIDVPGTDTETQIFMLEYSSAEVLASQIQEVLLGGTTPGGQPAPGQPGQPQIVRPQPPRAPMRPSVPGAQRQPQVVGAREPVLRIVPEDRLNALVVVASPGYMEQVRDLIDKLDTPTPYEAGNWHIYELQNANAEEMVDALNSLIGAAPPVQSGGAGGAGGGGGGGGGGASMGGGGPAGAVAAFEREVSITQYEVTNALLIVATPQDYKRLAEIIARLDVPQRQVHVDAVIMEVGINDNFSLAVESAALTANDYFALNNVVDLANLLTQGPLASPPPGTAIGIIDGTTEVTLNVGGQQVVQTIPNVPLLITALESVTDLNVLSQPSLTTVDNQEANIVDGLNVPFVRGSSSSLDQSTIGRSIYNTVDREDVGMKLKVKPQISEGDYVYLELEVELSQPVQSSVGADPNIVGPTIQKTNVTNHVVIKDGSIGVIGGFLRESTDRAVRQPPVLGDVPLVGWLFRRKDNQRAKRNLVMLVSPHVIKERKDLDRVSEYKLGQFQDANADTIFTEGFIRKIERKQETRNKHHPSFEKAEELQQEKRSFGRGSAQR